MIPCMYDRAQHEILGGELSRWIKTVPPAKDADSFFLYHHRIADTFVIGRWAKDRAFGIFTDFLHIGHSLAEFDRKKAEEFRQRLFAPISATKMARAIQQNARDYTTNRINEDGENQENRQRILQG